MKFTKLNAPSLKDLFVSELETMILSGKLEIGTKLPSERELAASMQVSRAVVNAGIAELEQKGFLVVKPRIGTFVEDYHRNGTIETLTALMKYNGGMLGDSEIRSILEIRMIFVGLSATLAADTASEEEILSLKKYLDALKICTDNDEAVELLFSFYHELAFISGNTLLPLFIASFRELVCPLWFRFARNYGIPTLYENTLEFYRSLVARDKETLMHLAEKSSRDSIEGIHTIYTR